MLPNQLTEILGNYLYCFWMKRDSSKDAEMKFQWPKDVAETKEITSQQLEWLLQGLSKEQKRALHPVKMSA